MSVVPLHALHTADRNRATSTPRGICTAHFGELRRPLLEFIDHSEVVVGCVAWVTERHILEALARRPVALVVQKENWWKKTDVRGQALARRYAALTGGLPAALFPDPLGTKTFRGKPVPNDAALAPIACVGYGSGSQHQPLMHHKFLVRCVLDGDGALLPVAVWTGSFNFSGNADRSFENAVEIHDPTIAAAYLTEFALVASVSEPMNWRLARPNPKGAGAGTIVVPPAKTTSRVVKRTQRRRATKPGTRTTGTRSGTVRKTAAKKTTAKKAGTARTTAQKSVAKKTAKKATATRSPRSARKAAPRKRAA